AADRAPGGRTPAAACGALVPRRPARLSPDGLRLDLLPRADLRHGVGGDRRHRDPDDALARAGAVEVPDREGRGALRGVDGGRVPELPPRIRRALWRLSGAPLRDRRGHRVVAGAVRGVLGQQLHLLPVLGRMRIRFPTVAKRLALLLVVVLAGDRALAWMLARAVSRAGTRFARAYRGGVDADVLVAGDSRGVNGLYGPAIRDAPGL